MYINFFVWWNFHLLQYMGVQSPDSCILDLLPSRNPIRKILDMPRDVARTRATRAQARASVASSHFTLPSAAQSNKDVRWIYCYSYSIHNCNNLPCFNGRQKCIYPRSFPYDSCHSWVAIEVKSHDHKWTAQAASCQTLKNKFAVNLHC